MRVPAPNLTLAYPVGYKEGRGQATWKREFKLPWREAGLLKQFSMIKWIRTSRLSIKNSLSETRGRSAEITPVTKRIRARWLSIKNPLLSLTHTHTFFFSLSLSLSHTLSLSLSHTHTLARALSLSHTHSLSLALWQVRATLSFFHKLGKLLYYSDQALSHTLILTP